MSVLEGVKETLLRESSISCLQTRATKNSKENHG